MTKETPDEPQAPQSSPQTETLAQQSPATKKTLRTFVFLFCIPFGGIFGLILIGALRMPVWLEVPCGLGVIFAGYKISLPRFPFFSPIICGLGTGMSLGTAIMYVALSNMVLC